MELFQFAQLVSDEFVRAGYRHFCGHDATADVDDAVLDECKQVLDEAVDERPLQEFLELHPALLTGELNMYCRWVLPQVSLGAVYIPDFLTTRLDSGGLNWTLVELESPRAQLFTRDGTPAAKLRKGLRQVEEWRQWLDANRDMARRPRSQGGLGLIGIEGRLSAGIVIVGRAADRTDRDRELLRHLAFKERVEIRSYDWLLRDALDRRNLRRDFGALCKDCVASSMP